MFVFSVQFAKQTPTLLKDSRIIIFFQNLAKSKADAFETLSSVQEIDSFL